MNKLWIIGLLFLSACTTAQVTQSCNAVEAGVEILPPLPAEAGLAEAAVGIGATICGSPEYAIIRNTVIGWFK